MKKIIFKTLYFCTILGFTTASHSVIVPKKLQLTIENNSSQLIAISSSPKNFVVDTTKSKKTVLFPDTLPASTQNWQQWYKPLTPGADSSFRLQLTGENNSLICILEMNWDSSTPSPVTWIARVPAVTPTSPNKKPIRCCPIVTRPGTNAILYVNIKDDGTQCSQAALQNQRPITGGNTW